MPHYSLAAIASRLPDSAARDRFAAMCLFTFKARGIDACLKAAQRRRMVPA